jgi:hypothetical protein
MMIILSAALYMPHFLFIFIRHAGFATVDSEALSRPANETTHVTFNYE